MSVVTRPMLADSVEDTGTLHYPVIGSPKIDGIRCLIVDGQALSRKFKPIPNHHIRTTLERILPEGADGEILSGSTFQDVSSAVMSHDGQPEFRYCMFDLVSCQGCEDQDLNQPYGERLKSMDWWWDHANKETRAVVEVLPTKLLRSEEELLEFEQKCLAKGHEGVMLRTPDGPYIPR